MINIVFDVSGCTRPNPPATSLLQAMRDTAALLGCTVLGELPVAFQPHGATCVIVLAESHLTVSTWPEHHMAYIDVFTCRADVEPATAIKPILAVLGASNAGVARQRIHRLRPARLSQPVGLTVSTGP
ncbi:MAG: S-adenosylmethionine decarboxylase proenzyme [Dactylosporangium sp.]|nr:S-adenosylmethionine decarboxylase [Dactylosporangium sp.]NNJ62903.1 S-adenosylmethionine decarboxylase proenzyme [Dactylosporangium sp.]